jgi:sirohydrochlorin ferrochelatase
MSIVSETFNAWRECRAEYDDTLHAQFNAAEEATNGAMLNARGREKRIEPFTLFMGNETRARAYAFEELIEHWETHPRITFAKFERKWQQQREAELIEDAA